ncbi:MAG: penicillin acylase family protein, partial [Pseudomonadota bacterium]
RIQALLTARSDFTLDDLRALQRDTHLAPAAVLARTLAPRATRLAPGSKVAAALAAWDGDYAAGSAGALAFELVAAGLIEALEAQAQSRQVSPAWRPFTRLTRLVERAGEDLEPALANALKRAEAPFARHRTWGGLHRLRLVHPLGRLPWLAARLPRLDLPAGGTNETLMKSMHPVTRKEHATGFAANARFLADLAEPDRTHAIVLGGQDGWPGSSTMFDMVAPWRKGDTAQLPVSDAGLAAHFPHQTTIKPADA